MALRPATLLESSTLAERPSPPKVSAFNVAPAARKPTSSVRKPSPPARAARPPVPATVASATTAVAGGSRPSSGDSARGVGRCDSARAVGRSIVGVVGSAAATNSTQVRAASATPTAGAARTARTAPADGVTATQGTSRGSAAASTAEPDPVLVIDRAAEEENRAKLTAYLQKVPFVDPGEDPIAFHGRLFQINSGSAPAQPTVQWKSDKKPRQNSPDWLTATEYSETPQVFQAKVKLLAQLLRASHRTMAYTGAGLSVAAGIGMAAVGSSAQGGMGVATAGEPTLSHCVLAELNRQNLLHGWVQQNHDGLPQKAGYRQEDINEVHGSWFDPSNPVVKYSGSLRGDLFEDMENQADIADLVLVLGTSLTGLNADQCVHKTANRSRAGQALGSVIISPQRTSQDGKCALRIFAKADDVMTALVKEFQFGPRALGKSRGVRRSADLYPKEDKVLVPYDAQGVRSTTVKTYWDLSRGAKLRMGCNNNIKGAKQPNDSNITNATVGTCTGRDESTCSFTVSLGGTTKKLGLWWLETAKRGGVETLPLVNIDAKEMRA